MRDVVRHPVFYYLYNMADNYLERKMEEHRAGHGQVYRPKLTPSGKRQGELTFKFPPRRVLVTGGASGIGRAIVKAFCDAGCKVAFCDSDTAAGTSTAQALGARFYPLDVIDTEALEKCMQSVFDLWGDIDVLVNNVGVGNFKPLMETGIEDFDHVMHVNVRPVFVTSRRLAIHRASLSTPNPYGRIINICSTRHAMSEAGTEAYSASKGAIASLTHALMMSYSGTGVTVNAISPGWIATGDTTALSAADHAQHPSGRVGVPDDIARTCLWLALPDNDFVNGENIIIDGGMTRKMIYV